MNIQPLEIGGGFQEIKTDIVDISDYLISPDVEVEKPTPILSVKQNQGDLIDIFTEGNISMIQGQAKSRKSTFLKSIIQAFVNGHNEKLYSSYPHKEVIVVDTEQSEWDCYKAVKMIKILTGKTIQYYSVSVLNKNQRKYLVESALENNPECKFIVLDNIVHFMQDFNSNTETSEVIDWLIKLKAERKIHICVVLHENPGGVSKARGHLGTSLEQICETIISVRIDGNNEDRSIVKAKATRGKRFNEFLIYTDLQGEPFLEDMPRYERRKI